MIGLLIFFLFCAGLAIGDHAAALWYGDKHD